eukprot:1331048-Pyramimonas_sp.AAC.1
MQDARKGKLLVRFKAVDASLHVSRGVLGQARLEQGSAHHLTDKTFCMIGDACTSNLAPPYRPPTAPEKHID